MNLVHYRCCQELLLIIIIIIGTMKGIDQNLEDQVIKMSRN